MGNNLRRSILMAGFAIAAPEAALASIPRECKPSDFAAATAPGGASFQETNSPGDIDRKFAKLEPASESATLDGVISSPEIYYPFGAISKFGFRVKLVVGLSGRVRCIALAPSWGQEALPEWNPQRRNWAGSISRWRFRPLVVDGKPTEALTQLDIHEYELPQKEVPMPEGDPSQVVITQDMPYFGYHVELHGDGSAIFSSTRPYYFLGPQAYHVDPKSVAQVLQDAKDVDFWSLRDVYPPEAGNDGGYISKIEITLGGKTKSLTEYDKEADTGLLNDAHFLAFGIRHTIDLGDWWAPKLSTIDQLKLNGFDFKSVAAGRFLLQIAGNKDVDDNVVLAVMALGAPQDAFGVSREDEDPRSLLEAALYAGRTKVAKQFIADGGLMTGGQTDSAKVDRAFQASIESGDMAAAELILPFRPSLTFVDTKNGNLKVSVLFKIPVRYLEDPAPVDLTKRLLDLGVDVNSRAPNGETLLHRERDNEDMAKFLLEHGADINALDNSGSSPLVCGSEEDMTLYLLEHGADPRVGNNPKAMREILNSGRWPRVNLWLRGHGFLDVVTTSKE